MSNQLENRISSREVAEMMEVNHADLLRKLIVLMTILEKAILHFLNIG